MTMTVMMVGWSVVLPFHPGCGSSPSRLSVIFTDSKDDDDNDNENDE